MLDFVAKTLIICPEVGYIHIDSAIPFDKVYETQEEKLPKPQQFCSENESSKREVKVKQNEQEKVNSFLFSFNYSILRDSRFYWTVNMSNFVQKNETYEVFEDNSARNSSMTFFAAARSDLKADSECCNSSLKC